MPAHAEMHPKHYQLSLLANEGRLVWVFVRCPINRTPSLISSFESARVTSNFQAELFDAANRAGITPNEFIITDSAEKLSRSGMPYAGVICRGEARAIFKAIARGKSVGTARRSILERLGAMAQGDIPHEITIFSSPANSY